jgi:hypothetical protein
LKLDDRQDGLVVGGGKIHTLEDRGALRHNGSADKDVGVSSPSHRGGLSIAEVDSSEPGRSISLVSTRLDRSGEGLGPGLSIRQGVASSILLRHVGIPDVVEVGGGGPVCHIDVVSSILQVLVVKGLVDITDKLIENNISIFLRRAFP